MPDNSPIWKKLQRVQRELKHGTPATQDAPINALRDYLDDACANRLFPAFLYPHLQRIFSYYCEQALPQTNLRTDDRNFVQEGFARTFRQVNEQELRARACEARFKELLRHVKAGKLESAARLLREFHAIIAAESKFPCDYGQDDRALREVEQAYRDVRTHPFTRQQVIPFFETFFVRSFSQETFAAFETFSDLFWNQLHDLLFPKVVLVNPSNRNVRLIRLEIAARLEAGRDDLTFSPDSIDDRMYSSCLNAVQAVRLFFSGHLPEFLNNQAIHVTCRFANPLLEYTDTSASLAVGLHITGDLLDLEIQPHILVSGEVNASGELVPVRYAAEKLAEAERHHEIQELWLPEGVAMNQNGRVRIRRLSTFRDAVEQYYGKPLQQTMKELRRRTMAMASEIPAVNGRAERSSRLKPATEIESGASAFMSYEPGDLSSGKKRPLAYSRRHHVGLIVGRDEMLIRLKNDLRDPQNVFLALDGIAGIGKTTIASKLAEEMEDEFRDDYWFKCSPDTDLDQILAELAYFLSEHGDQTFANVFAYNIPTKNKLDFLIGALGKPTPNPSQEGNWAASLQKSVYSSSPTHF